jgi:pilin isopeptide linkage protein
MKKVLTVILLLAAIPLLFNTALCASAYTPATAEIAVEIKHGGTAVIIPEVNCPIPDKTELKLEDGEVGRFNIQFTEPGIYTYTVKTVPDSRNLDFDSTVYTVIIYVTDENGTLKAVKLVYAGGVKYAGEPGSDGSPDVILFENTEPEQKETTTQGGNPVIPVVPPVPGLIIPVIPEITTAPGGNTSPSPETTTSPGGTSRSDTAERTTAPEGTGLPETEDNNPAPQDKSNPKTSDDTDMEMYFLIAVIASAGLLVLSIIYAADCRKLIKSKENSSHTDS